MALTFDEVFSTAPQTIPPNFVWAVYAGIVITQEDSRTGYSRHFVDAHLSDKRLEWSFVRAKDVDPMEMAFSDRNWDYHRDEIGVRIGLPKGRGGTKGRILLSIMLKSWGFGISTVELDLMANSMKNGPRRLYQGLGPTIGGASAGKAGGASGKAVYMVTFGPGFLVDRTPILQ